MARTRARRWDESSTCRLTVGCRSIAGNHGQCLMLGPDGKLHWADGRLAIGAHPLTGPPEPTKRRPTGKRKPSPSASKKKIGKKKTGQLGLFALEDGR